KTANAAVDATASGTPPPSSPTIPSPWPDNGSTKAAAACTSLTSTAPSKANPSTAALSLPSPKPTPIYPSRSVVASAAQRPSNTTSRPGFNTSSSAPKPLKNHGSSLTCANNSPVTSSSASTPKTAGLPPMAGQKCPTFRRQNLPSACSRTASVPSSTPTSPATA